MKSYRLVLLLLHQSILVQSLRTGLPIFVDQVVSKSYKPDDAFSIFYEAVVKATEQCYAATQQNPTIRGLVMSEILEEQQSTGSGFFSSSSFPPRRRFFSLVFSEKVLLDIVAVSDVIVAFLTAYLVKFVYFSQYLNQPGDSRSYFLLIIFSCTFLHLSLKKSGLYEPRHIFEPAKPIFAFFCAIAFTAAVTLALLFLLKETAYYSRAWFIGWFFTTFAFLVCFRFLWSAYFQSLAERGFFRQNVVLIGGGTSLRSAQGCLNVDESRRHVVQIIDLNASGDAKTHASPRPEQESLIEGLIRDAQQHLVDKIIVALPAHEGELLHYLIARLRLLPIEVKILPHFSHPSVPIHSVEDEGGVQLLSVQRKPISDWGICLKMAEDYVLGSLLAFTFLPAMALIAIAIKLDSRGPVLFRQRRHGFNHEVIQVLKFRTMTVLEDGHQIQQATKNDQRITRIGRFLRRTSLDELPQLFNVLKGNMSLVGPRPHALAHNDHYSKLLDNYAIRHRVKPGLTGWAQVNGFRGETPDGERMQMRVNHDLEYIDNWSIWFDLKILLMTPFYGFVSKQAY